MAYDKVKIFEKAKEIIQKYKLIFIEDVCAYLAVSKDWFYRSFPIGSDEYDELSDLLAKNKIDIKISIRHKWFKSDNPTAQMALYKLCSTKEEHKLLQQNYTDVTTEGEKLSTTPTIVFKDFDDGD